MYSDRVLLIQFVKLMRRFFALLCGAAGLVLPLSASVVINEIHYDPDVKTEPVEFIELHNAGTNTVNLGGWTLSDGGNLNFVLPSTNVAPGGFVVVAQNPAALQAKFNLTNAVGPMRPDGTTSLSKYGEKIVLRNAVGDQMDEVEYQLGFPWPTVGEPPGYSAELVHPSLDNNLGGSWRASVVGAGVTATDRTFVQTNSAWKYFKGTSEASAPTNAWRLSGFDDAAWFSGNTPVGYGETFVTNFGTVLGDMGGNYAAVYFRKTFVVTNVAEITALILEAQYDDGFKAWINGVPLATLNMPASDTVPFNATALVSFETINFVTAASVSPAAFLVPGTNILAIQAHNVQLTSSSDFFLDVRLRGSTGSGVTRGPTPGRINSVFAANNPPQVRQVEHQPKMPVAGQPVVVSAKVTDPDAVTSVLLQYQLVDPGSYIELTDAAFTNNWTSLAMNDAGTGGDAVAGDATYSVTLPGSFQTHRRLIRYRIIATDGGGRSIQVPYADDPQPNFAYFCYNGVPAWTGKVEPIGTGSNAVARTISSNEMARLPVIQLIGRSNTVATATWFSRYGGDAYQWQGTLVYDGQVLDHIRYRARGGVWRYSMVKNMWKFDLNRGHDLEVRDNWGKKYKTAWTKLNLGSAIQQGDFNHRGEQGMFESLGFRLFQLADVGAPHTAFASFRVIDDALEQDPASQYEGDFWGVYLMIEQENGRFLEEHNLPDANLYKMEGGTGELNNLSPTGPTDKSDLNYILNNYSGATEQWWRTNWNLPRFYSYQTIVSAIHHYDINGDKNFFYYRNSDTRLWEVVSWDLDLTWAHNMYNTAWGGRSAIFNRLIGNSNDGASAVENGTGIQAGTMNIRLPGARPVIETELRNRIREIRDLLFNEDQGFTLLDEYVLRLRGPVPAASIIDADRMMWDYNPKMNNSAYTPNLGKAGFGRYYAYPGESATNVSLRGSFDATIQIMKHYIRIRAQHLDALAADGAIPGRPIVTHTGPAGYPINRLTFRSSNYSGANPFASMRWRLGEITDTNAPNFRADEPQKYEIETVWDSGPIPVFNADVTIPPGVVRVGGRYRLRVQHVDSTGRASRWSAPAEFVCGVPESTADLLNHLRITEIMFNPPVGGYEYVELHNSSASLTLDLAGVKFTDGIDYTFGTGATLPPGGYLLVIGTTNLPAFRAFYSVDPSVTIVAAFSGALNNAGEQIRLRTSAGGDTIAEFTYGDGRGWPQGADGGGQSLVLIDSALQAQGSGAGEYGGNWRGSTFLRGSPGRADPTPAPGPVLNEFAANTDPVPPFDGNDWIELFNPTGQPMLLGAGWFLSDDSSTYDALKKWQIPTNTTIPARGWVSFDENTGFHNPTNIGFALSKGGEQIFLSYLPGTTEDRIVDAVTFKAQEKGWTLGRYPDGEPLWHALTPPTRGTTNGAPQARVVINEVMFHPPDVLSGTNLVDNNVDEFLELLNATPNPVSFQNTNGTWRLNGAVDFIFPANLTLLSGELMLVVNFSPTNTAQLAAFKALYGITNAALRILGPYSGDLANSSERVALEYPQAGDLPGSTPNWAIVDEVLYADQSPWPCSADGTGDSLQRISALAHGNDAANWSSEPPTAGRPRANLPAGLPALTAQPLDRIAPTNGSASFSVSVCGTPPFTYQWLFQDSALSGATNATLTLFNLTLADAGPYRAVISNNAGSITSAVAVLVVQLPPFITAHPQPVTAIRDQSAMFSVAAGGTPPLTYQWRFNGNNLPGATNAMLTLQGLLTNQAGLYSALVRNSAGSALSTGAQLTLLIPATISQQPTNRSQTVTYNAGLMIYNPTNASFVVNAFGTGPLAYQWRFNGQNLPGATTSTLVLSNVQPGLDGAYSVVVTDNIGSAISSNAVLTVLVPPVFLASPVSQSAVVGGAISLSAAYVAYPPPVTMELRNPSTGIRTNVETLGATYFHLPNLTTNDTRSYRFVAKNAANPNPGVASPLFSLTVLADTDGDGIPDAWETQYGLNPTNGLAPQLDNDGDGVSNLAEFIAGTDPTDPLSYLKVELAALSQAATVKFGAISNKTYSVLFRDRPANGDWLRLADVVARATNRLELVPDPTWTTNRFYRVATPRQP